MAVTRIKNNQITDASGANTQLGVNAAVKLQNYSVTAGKLANSLVYGSDLTVSGNLTVNGTTTTIDTINTLIKDPILTLADGQTAGTPTVDIGLIGLRGNQLSSFIGWNEGNTEFAVILSNTTASNTTVNINEYANFHANSVLVGGNLSVVGNITGSINFTGNVTAGNLLTTGQVSATANVTGGNVLTGGLISATGNATSGNVNTAGLISATGNITGGNLITSGSGGAISGTGNITGGNIFTGGVVSATGNVTGGNVNFGSGIVSGTGNIYADTIFANISGNIDAAGSNTQIQFNGPGDILAANANFTYDYATNLLTVNGGNIDTGNLSATGQVSATANVSGGNILTGGLVSATGNATAGNVLTAGLVSATGNVTGGNINTAGLASVTGNVIGGNVTTVGLVSATGNVNGGNIISSALVEGVTVSASGNVIGGNVTTAGLISATGNATAGNVLTGGLVSATGNATAGNVLTGGLVSATGNVDGGNILTAGLISAGGNITSATNVNTPNVVASGNLELFGGNILLTAGTGNIVVNSKNINGVAEPVQNNDVATKIYVDNLVSTQIAYHPPVFAATISNLATATGGTITYTQPNGAGNGVGALITTTGAFTVIDTANVQTANTRILVKNEGNAALNGVYGWANATTIIRTSDADTYGPNSATDLSINDYFFVQSGNVNAGSAYIVNEPTGVITFGTSNITFAQFSSSQTYTGGNGISLYGTVISTVYDNSTIGINGSNQLYIPANAPLVTPNIGAATGTSLSVTGTVTANTNISAVGNVIGGNVTTVGLVSATGNITTADTLNGANLSLSGNVLSALNVTGNITGGNLLTPGLVSATGNATAGNINTAGLASVTGNVIAGNVTTAGLISATGNVTGGNLISNLNIFATNAANVTFNDNTWFYSGYTTMNTSGIFHDTGANPDTIQVSTNSRANGIALTTAGTANSAIVSTGGFEFVTGGTLNANTAPSGGTSTAQITAAGLTVSGIVSATGNVTGGNILTSGLISASGNIDGANINGTIYGNVNATTVSATGNITGGNLLTGGLISATGTITSANVITGLTVSATGNVIGGNVTTTGLISATGNATAGNILTSGLISATGNINGGNVTTTGTASLGNIVISGDTITGTNGQVLVNSALADVNFAVSGLAANVFFVDAGTNTASFGSATQTTNAIVAFNTTNSILLPAGTLGERPATGVTGMLRFNSTNNGLEIYDNSEWTPVGTTTFTVIADEQFNGDGVNVAFTLSSSQTTNSCIVSINGVVQIPGSAYSVAGTDPTCVLTFTEAPAEGDLIDVREITTTTTVTAISNNSGNAQITGSPTSAAMTVLGNLIPTANVTYSLGNATNYWKSLYVGGNTIYLGGLQLQSATGNVFNVFASDGTTPATFGNITVGGNLTGNISTNSITNSGANGTGNIGSSTTYFNTVFAKATSAQYADLAEKYVADAAYAPGTVVSFGGEKEVTQSTVDADRAVAGVVSTNPSYIMNATLEAEHVAVVAFTGRVPTSVTGTVAKGDLMVSNGDGTARAEADPKAGAIIGKALENFDGDTGTIEVVIGRF